MEYVICSVRDVAVGAFGRPIFVVSKAQGVRSFRDEVNRAESEMHAHPEDYALFYLGVFDDQGGQFRTLEMPELLVEARNLVEEK